MGSSRPAGAYGTDAAWVPWLWIGFSALYVLFTVLSATVWNTPIWVTVALALVAVFFLGGAGPYQLAGLVDGSLDGLVCRERHKATIPGS